MRCRDDVEARTEVLAGPAGSGAGGDRWRDGGAPSGAVVPGELVVHLQVADPPEPESRSSAAQAHSARQEQALFARVQAEPDITLARLRDWLCDRHGVRLSNGAVWSAVKRLGFTFKKTLSASEQERPDVAARRAGWKAAQPFIDPERLVFIDETGANTKMTRLYGRAPRGHPVRGATTTSGPVEMVVDYVKAYKDGKP